MLKKEGELVQCTGSRDDNGSPYGVAMALLHLIHPSHPIPAENFNTGEAEACFGGGNCRVSRGVWFLFAS